MVQEFKVIPRPQTVKEKDKIARKISNLKSSLASYDDDVNYINTNGEDIGKTKETIYSLAFKSKSFIPNYNKNMSTMEAFKKKQIFKTITDDEQNLIAEDIINLNLDSTRNIESEIIFSRYTTLNHFRLCKEIDKLNLLKIVQTKNTDGYAESIDLNGFSLNYLHADSNNPYVTSKFSLTKQCPKQTEITIPTAPITYSGIPNKINESSLQGFLNKDYKTITREIVVPEMNKEKDSNDGNNVELYSKDTTDWEVSLDVVDSKIEKHSTGYEKNFANLILLKDEYGIEHLKQISFSPFAYINPVNLFGFKPGEYSSDLFFKSFEYNYPKIHITNFLQNRIKGNLDNSDIILMEYMFNKYFGTGDYTEKRYQVTENVRGNKMIYVENIYKGNILTIEIYNRTVGGE